MKTIKMGIEITNPQRIIYENQKITKLDVINYYERVAPLMLPYIQNRLLSVIRCHNGIKGGSFFKKHPSITHEEIKTFKKDGEIYYYLTSKKGIILEAQLGTIEFHTGGSNIKNIEKPNVMVFDLDPDEKLPLKNLQNGVILLKNLLDELKLKSYLKTSGGKGYHIVVPFSRCSSYKTFSEFAKNIALILEAKHKDIFTTNIRKKERNGKIFIDYLRNDNGSTCVAPYSLRARENAGISFPIPWNNLNKVAPSQITIKNVNLFLKKANPWHDFFETRQHIK